MNHLRHPSNSHDSGEPPIAARGELVEFPFRVGDPDETFEIINGDGKRKLFWHPTKDDWRLGEAAGWDRLTDGIEDGGWAFLEIPEGTRSASSVLSGMEALENEKAAVIDFLGRYVAFLKHHYNGAVDLGASFDNIGVTKTRMKYIAPPHRLTTVPQEVARWKWKIENDAKGILRNEPHHDFLLDRLHKQL